METTASLSIRCACGAMCLTATGVSPAVSNHMACHCEGCQTFARRMGHDEILDPLGGTERIQISPATLTITKGRAHLGCVQQTRKGALRWVARCCDSPLALTLPTRGTPFVAIDAKRIVLQPGTELNDLVGPLRARVNTASGVRIDKAGFGALLGMLWHLTPLTFRWWWRGDHKRSPFFDRDTAAPIVVPERLYDLAPVLRLSAGCR